MDKIRKTILDYANNQPKTDKMTGDDMRAHAHILTAAKYLGWKSEAEVPSPAKMSN